MYQGYTASTTSFLSCITGVRCLLFSSGFSLQLQQRVCDVGKTLDLLQLLNEGGEVHNMMGEKFDWGQFKGRLQLDTPAIMGHSFGGTTTLQTLYSDKRFK